MPRVEFECVRCKRPAAIEIIGWDPETDEVELYVRCHGEEEKVLLTHGFQHFAANDADMTYLYPVFVQRPDFPSPSKKEVVSTGDDERPEDYYFRTMNEGLHRRKT